MVKALILTVGMALIIVLLLIIAVKPPTLVTVPVPEQAIQITPEELTPRALEREVLPPTKKAEEPAPLPPGIPAGKVYPNEVYFWVNEIRVPASTDYEGRSYIPIKKSKLKTFAGHFGPYFEDPTPYITVFLCAEFYKIQAAPACEPVPLLYRGNYVTFAKGYQFDEFIGGMAAKDYIAYYDVVSGDSAIAKSNIAVIRTVKD